MLLRIRSLSIGLIALLQACRADDATSALTPLGFDHPPHAAVFPPASYVAGGLPDPGEFTDVSENNQMVGNITLPGALYRSAFSLKLGGAVRMLLNGGGIYSSAAAVNSNGAIAGTVFNNSLDYYPAVWMSTRGVPLTLQVQGTASDINDAGLVVGTQLKSGSTYGFVWDPAAGTVTYLPPLRGGRTNYAIAINANNAILGSSSSSSGWTSVLWTWTGRAWSPQAIVGGINALALDNNRFVVGQTASQASWGKPDHAGYFGVGVFSHATGVAPDGSAAIGESSYPVTGPAVRNAWVANRFGSVTFLPIPNSLWTETFGRSVNSCGLAVGLYTDFRGIRLPAYWNPGC